MSGTTDLDRMIVEWLREGETAAPGRLASEISRAILVARPRGPARLFPSLATWRGRIWVGVAVAMLVVASLVAIGSLGGPRLPGPTTSPGPSSSPSSASTPAPTASAQPTPSLPAPVPTEPPPPTYPPARSWAVGRLTLDLPEGWGDPPGSFALALMSVLDERHDPDAGVFNMILHGGPAENANAFRFHVNDTVSPGTDAGIRVLLVPTPGVTAATAADQAQAVLENGAYTVKRTTITLALGRGVVLEWDQSFNGPPLHFRALFIDAGDAVIRFDLGTKGAPSKAISSEFLGIVGTVRLALAPGASP